ncbi:hypothetical protein SAMN03159324_05081 [Pseudomonas sp. NFPP18]|nr:hypothetical protein SAMN03159460_06202 [Pseudomonas sp. NFPP17]SEL72913.1 hypothetical protein SAMN03159324_05081 [Pseudomonas sp. NFPP18]SFA66365.1 hypothetical protein SAMN03159320_04899 [Pseudomonas sp. NFPP13]SFU13205.1 hypothetical protein SAMN03159492_06156 [Pseudomonas sp. NFPP25]
MKKPRMSEAVGGTGAEAREIKRPVGAGRLVDLLDKPRRRYRALIYRRKPNYLGPIPQGLAINLQLLVLLCSDCGRPARLQLVSVPRYQRISVQQYPVPRYAFGSRQFFRCRSRRGDKCREALAITCQNSAAFCECPKDSVVVILRYLHELIFWRKKTRGILNSNQRSGCRAFILIFWRGPVGVWHLDSAGAVQDVIEKGILFRTVKYVH